MSDPSNHLAHTNVVRKHIASTPTLAGARVVPTRRISRPDSMDRSVEAVERMDIIACVLTHSPILGWRGGAARLLERRYVCHSLAIVEVWWAARGSSSCEWFAYLGHSLRYRCSPPVQRPISETRKPGWETYKKQHHLDYFYEDRIKDNFDCRYLDGHYVPVY